MVLKGGIEKVPVKKVVVIGAGSVGATTAYNFASADWVDELVLIDINRNRAEGEAMDIADGTVFSGTVKVYAGNYEDTKDAVVVVFAAGANQRPGETRLDLAGRNLNVLRDVIEKLCKYWSGGVLLIVTNPVDVLTYAAQKFSDLPSNLVIGTGTVLDTARFRYLLSKHCKVDARNVHAYVLGEHGDSSVCVWSSNTIACVHVDEFCKHRGIPIPDRKEFSDKVKRAAAEIIARKGATYYAISLGIRRVCEAVIRNQNSVLTVSGLIDGQYGITGTAFSLPTVIGQKGRIEVLDISLHQEEEQELINSANILKQVQREHGL